MDVELVSNVLTDPRDISQGQLLSHLPDRLTASQEQGNQEQAAHINRHSNQSGAVITKIEDIIESMADCILDGKKPLVIYLKSRRKRVKREDDEDEGDTEAMAIRFPSRKRKEAWRFTTLLRILEFSHEALVTGVVATKRDIYYRDPNLFIKQAIVDQFVDDIAYTFGVDRDALNIVAAAKGLVAGSFIITRKDQSVFNYSIEREGSLIPNSKELEELRLLDVQWILVIEKEATFRTLATTQYWEHSMAGKGILITAKGYPDIQTRQFLHLLSNEYPEIPIFALVDFDPDGIGIMSTYKYGSTALAHESYVAVPSIVWFGIRCRDIIHDHDTKGLLKLTTRDRAMASKMLQNILLQQEEEWRRELQVMLMLNMKAEIQILGSGDRLEHWIDTKLQESGVVMNG